MQTGIKRVELVGIHGHQHIVQELGPGLNILHGKNGAGKTTFLHVLANLLERDLERFCHIQFESVDVTTLNGAVISLRQVGSNDERPVEVTVDGKAVDSIKPGGDVPAALDQLLEDRLGGRPVYLPAFRPILEGTSESARRFSRMSDRDEYEREIHRIARRESAQLRDAAEPGRPFGMFMERGESIALKTVLCRRWFGDFVPVVRYPSLSDVQEELQEEVRRAAFELAKTDQETLSSVFLHVLEVVLGRVPNQPNEDMEQLLERVKTNLELLSPGTPGVHEIYNQLALLIGESAPNLTPTGAKNVLAVYDQALSGRAQSQAQAYSHIKRFIDSVNKFLEGKHIEAGMRPSRGQALFVILPGDRRSTLSVLSSGERHVLTLLFSATHMSSSDGIVLFDEPELSLHVDWQRIILSELISQVGDRQVIACTHSPEIAAEHSDCLRELISNEWASVGSPNKPDILDPPMDE